MNRIIVIIKKYLVLLYLGLRINVKARFIIKYLVLKALFDTLEILPFMKFIASHLILHYYSNIYSFD